MIEGRRWMTERHRLKILLESHGAIVSFPMKPYSYLFFVTSEFVGWKKIRTADRIVARAGYCARAALRMVAEQYPNGL